MTKTLADTLVQLDKGFSTGRYHYTQTGEYAKTVDDDKLLKMITSEEYKLNGMKEDMNHKPNQSDKAFMVQCARGVQISEIVLEQLMTEFNRRTA